MKKTHLSLFTLFILCNLLSAQTLNLISTNNLRVSLSHSDLEVMEYPESYRVVSLNKQYPNASTLQLTDSNGTVFSYNKIQSSSLNTRKSWTGKLENSDFGYLIISELDGVIWAKAELDLNRVIQIRPLNSNNSVNVLFETHTAHDDEAEETDELLEEEVLDDDAPIRTISSEDTTDVCSTTNTCSEDNIDVLVVYTQDATISLGGSNAAAEAAIGMAMAELNLITSNSGLSTTRTFTLVGAEEVNYTESDDSSTDLQRLRNGGDGFLDEVHVLRDQYYADIVALITDIGGCGRGYVNTDPVQYDAVAAFSVTRDNCMTGNKTLSHEIGHNLGFRHDRYASGNPSTTTPCNHAFGYVNENAITGTSSQRWRTVMAYNTLCSDNGGLVCTRVNHWSNPDVNYNSEPTGKEVSDSESAHNVSILERAFCQAEDFRVAPTCTDCTIFQACDSYNVNTASGPGNSTTITISGGLPAVSSVSSSSDIELCIDYYGDHSASSEQFNIIDENNNIIGTTLASSDCDIPTKVCFTVDITTYNTWVADDAITINLDPQTTNINPSLCQGTSRACAQLLIPNDITLSLTDTNQLNDIRVYPNPANDFINIETSEEIISIHIYDASGKVVKAMAATDTVDISHLQSGVYIIRFTLKNKVYSKKLVIQ